MWSLEHETKITAEFLLFLTTDSGKVFPGCDQLIWAAWQTAVGNYTEDPDVCEEGAHAYCDSPQDHWKGREVRAQRIVD